MSVRIKQPSKSVANLEKSISHILTFGRVMCPTKQDKVSLGFYPGGGTPIWNKRGCSSEILNLTPKGDHLGVA